MTQGTWKTRVTPRKGRAKRNRSRKAHKKKGLTKVEKKQVTKIAKKAVNSMAESKYFNTSQSINAEVVNSAWKVSTDYADIGVWGYSTGYNRQNNPGDENETMKYGVSTVDGTEISMTNMKMNQVFLSDEGPLQYLRAYVIEGQTIRPAYNECKWFLNHVGQSTDVDNTKGLMYRLRCVRVTPRAVKGSFQDIDPQNDLFLNQVNQPFGIASLDYAGTSPLFTREQFHMAKVNSRKYKVHEDKFYTVAPAQTYHAAGDGTGNSALAVGTIAPGCLTVTTKHNLGKELFYPNAATSDTQVDAYPTSGFVPEYILWHVIALGDNGTASAARATPLGMTISARPVSTFKDI